MTHSTASRTNPNRLSTLIARLYGWACECLYHEVAWSYDIVSWLVSAGRWNAWRGAALNYVVGPSVLELGFGTGELLIQLARHQDDVHGIDLSPQMHRIAAAKIRRRKLPIPLCHARAQALPYADGTFQTVVSTFPAPYILDPETLRECTRILAPPREQERNGLSHKRSRLIIVGMWVTPRTPGWLRRFPVFFGQPSHEAMSALEISFRAAGLEPRFETFHDTWADVSVIVAERNS